jgi:inosine/xanthosine triphosphate pyrophosphatase family protein
MIRKIYLITSNDHKYNEIKLIFDSYNIIVERVDPESDIEAQVIFLLEKEEKCKTPTVIKEQIDLCNFYTNELVNYKTDLYIDCLRANVVSSMNVWTRKEGIVQHDFYTNKIEGFVDLYKKQNKLDVFGWDDIFVVKNTNMSYYEKKKKGFKISPRDNNISDFIHNHINYKNKRTFKFTNTGKQNRTIDFENTGCVNFIKQNWKLLNNDYSNNLGLNNLFVKICNEGAFFRSTQNTRENIYWCPGLNAGIPHIQKKDKIHELTFTVHDFFHFLIPDLVFTGETDTLSKNVYIITRMLSEAITIVLADMIFIETLRKSDIEYDWAKRKIWPLYNSINKNIHEMSTENQQEFLRKVIIANVKYCLLGDSSDYRIYESFQDFHDKYTPFFVEDYKWTNNNWDNLSNNKHHFDNWWTEIKPIRDHFKFGRLESIQEYIYRNNLKNDLEMNDLVFIILNDLLTNSIFPVLKTEMEIKPKLEIANCAFGRWIIGQFLIFNKFIFLPESKFYQQKIKKFILIKDKLSFQEIQNVRGLYEQYLDILFEKGLISGDDKITFSEFFPIFKPSFANYDKGIEKYQNISDVWISILKK